MVQRDYLLRQIEKMGAILAGIRRMIVAGEPVQALNELRAVAARVGLDLDVLGALAPGSLIAILGEDALERLIPAADVLLVKGELEEAAGSVEQSADSYLKAEILIRHLQDRVGEGSDPALRAQIDGLAARLLERRRPGG